MLSIKDRLQELRAAHSEYDPNRRYTIVGSANTNIVEVYKKVEEIKHLLNEVNECTRSLKKISSEITAYSSSGQEKIDSYINIANESIKKTFYELQSLEDEIDFDEEVCNAEIRIKYIQYTTLRQLYSETTMEYYNFLEKFRDTQVALITKQIKIKNESTQVDASHLLEQNKTNIFADNYLTETNEAKQILTDAQVRYKYLIKIESNLKDIKEIFLQFATAVYNQQDLVNRVEYHALNATNYVEQGTKQLETAVVTSKKTFKTKLKFIAVIFVILTLIIILFYISNI